MKDIKRRSFLKSVIGGLTALFVGVPKAKTNEVEVRFHSESPDDTAVVECYGYDENSEGYKRITDPKEDELIYKFLETQLKNTPILDIWAGTQYINGIKYKYVCFGGDSAQAVNCETRRDYRVWRCVDGEYIHYSV